MRKRALVLGKFRFISRRSGAEWETTLEFNQAVIKNGVTPIPYASRPLGFRTIPRSRSHTRYSILNAEFPGIEERYHVAWSTPLGDIHVDSMVKLYDLKSVQTHFVDIDCRGPKSQWFCLVDPRVTPTPDGKIQFDANMFWTVGLLYKHYNTCGIESWDDEISFMAGTHRLAENSAHEGTLTRHGKSTGCHKYLNAILPEFPAFFRSQAPRMELFAARRHLKFLHQPTLLQPTVTGKIRKSASQAALPNGGQPMVLLFVIVSWERCFCIRAK